MLSWLFKFCFQMCAFFYNIIFKKVCTESVEIDFEKNEWPGNVLVELGASYMGSFKL